MSPVNPRTPAGFSFRWRLLHFAVLDHCNPDAPDSCRAGVLVLCRGGLASLDLHQIPRARLNVRTARKMHHDAAENPFSGFWPSGYNRGNLRSHIADLTLGVAKNALGTGDAE